MVRGIDGFKEWFKGCENQYAIIGGTACDLFTRRLDEMDLPEVCRRACGW